MKDTILAFALFIPVGMIRAATIQQLWTWFIEATYDVPAPSLPVIYGAYMIFEVATIKTGETESATSPVAVFVGNVLACVLALVFSYIVSGFV
jgi:hypothetical protein